MKNSADRGGVVGLGGKHPPRSAEFFISYEVEFNNCFIIHSKLFHV